MSRRGDSGQRLGGWIGVLLGFLAPSCWLGGELWRRLLVAAGGGRGESAHWGEPLFYLLLLALPLALLGYFLGRRCARGRAR